MISCCKFSLMIGIYIKIVYSASRTFVYAGIGNWNNLLMMK